MMRYAAYIRTSTHSAETQSQVIVDWIERQAGRLVQTYTDERPGGDMDRPGLQQMLADAQRGAFDVLVVQRIDRLARREVDRQAIHRTLSQHNISIFAVSEKDVYA